MMDLRAFKRGMAGFVSASIADAGDTSVAAFPFVSFSPCILFANHPLPQVG